MENSSEPPLESAYEDLLGRRTDHQQDSMELPSIQEYSALPLIDFGQLHLGEPERKACRNLIAEACREWGFFQAVNHGVPRDLLEAVRAEQVKLMKKPFEEKKAWAGLNFSAGSYRWGTPSATTVEQLSWSEVFHLSLRDMLGASGGGSEHNSDFSSTMNKFTPIVFELAQTIAGILAEELGCKTSFFEGSCVPSSCYLRLNRYLPCPTSHPHMFGIVPHTDSSFLTVVHQDTIGGLQLVKDGKWTDIKPNSDALVINIGDLFQAWSNGVYKSVEHRVIANPMKERFSSAFFFCPLDDTVIQSDIEPKLYRGFSFEEFKKQVKRDVQILGDKVGLPRFLLSIAQ